MAASSSFGILALNGAIGADRIPSSTLSKKISNPREGLMSGMFVFGGPGIIEDFASYPKSWSL